MRLVILGLGYSAKAFLEAQRGAFGHITGTVRTAERAAAMALPGLDMLAYDGTGYSPALKLAIHAADALLVSVPPDAAGDPVLRWHNDDIASAPNLKWTGYLSTVGVYGDHDGAWVDEATPLRPVSARSVARVKAETQWLELGQRSNGPVQIFRLSGIYGPGRNALVNMANGTARRINKPGQVFNRIHVADIAGAVSAAMTATWTKAVIPTIFNITDHEPCPPQDVVAHAARLMGLESPPLVPFNGAELSVMGRSFYGENKRVSNKLVRTSIGYEFKFPDYRAGLHALWNSMKAS